MTRSQVTDLWGSLEAIAEAVLVDDCDAPVLCGRRCIADNGTDGCDCLVEPDGRCPDGCPSVLLAYGVI